MGPRPRPLRARCRALVLAAGLVAAGCAHPPPGPTGTSSTATTTASGEHPQPAGGAPGHPQPAGVRPTPSAAGTAPVPTFPGVSSTGAGASPDQAGLGGLSRAFLRPAPYSHVSVQTDTAGDATPPGQVVGRLTSVLSAETHKAVQVVAHHQLAGKGSGCWSDQDIAQATAGSRVVFTSGSTVALYVLFLDGSSCVDAAILGEAYGASSMVVFVDAAEQAAPLTVDPALYVQAVTTHELGHVLGLVNIGYHSTIDHEDPTHPHHSSDAQSVMYWKIDRGNVIQQLLNGPPQDFDQADQADLGGLRDGQY